MDLENLVKQFVIAEIQLAYWKAERRKLKNLLAPRTDWQVWKYKILTDLNFKAVSEQIDNIIPTQKLYTDLYESA